MKASKEYSNDAARAQQAFALSDDELERICGGEAVCDVRELTPGAVVYFYYFENGEKIYEAGMTVSVLTKDNAYLVGTCDRSVDAKRFPRLVEYDRIIFYFPVEG